MMRVLSLFLLLPLALLLPGTPASAQSSQGLSITSDAIDVRIGGRLQTQFNTTTIATEPPSELMIRRARLEVDVKVNEFISGSIRPEFAAGDVALRDAYVKLTLAPGFALLAGQAYKPFSLLEQTPSTRILPIERGARVRGMASSDAYGIFNGLRYSDRDIGVQVMGTPGFMPLGFTYQAGVFRGPLHGESPVQDSYQYAGRVTVQPHEVVRVGAGWSRRDFRATPASEADPFDAGNAFEVDVEVGTFAPGLHLLGEVVFGDADPNTGRDFFGAHGWLAWRSEPVTRAFSAIEPIFRASYGDSGSGFGTTTLLTPGVNLYVGGRNRFMVNYDIVVREDGPDPEIGTEGSFKAQFQLAF